MSEPVWIEHDQTGRCPVTNGTDVEMFLHERHSLRYRRGMWDVQGFNWREVLCYRVWPRVMK